MAKKKTARDDLTLIEKSMADYTGTSSQEIDRAIEKKYGASKETFEEEMSLMLDLILNSPDKYYYSYFIKVYKAVLTMAKEMTKSGFNYNQGTDETAKTIIKELGEALENATIAANKAYKKNKYYVILKEKGDTLLIIDGVETQRPDFNDKSDLEILNLLGNRIKNRTAILPAYYQTLKVKGYLETYSPIDEIKDFIKVSSYSESLKFGKKDGPEQLDLFEFMDSTPNKPLSDKEADKQIIIEQDIKVIGIDHSLAHSKALHAIQTLLHDTGYKGTSSRTLNKDTNSFYFSGAVPSIKITIPQYLDAYGVSKRMTNRGYQEYLSREREIAINALLDLHNNKVIMSYSRLNGKLNDNNEPLYDTIRTVRPLIQITAGYQNLTRLESEQAELPSEKLTHLVIEPAVILIDTIDTHFTIKPANLYKELKEIHGSKDKKQALFIEYLLNHAAERNRNRQIPKHAKLCNIKLNFDTIVYALRMDRLIAKREWSQIDKRINDYLDTAEKLGYIKEYNVEESTLGILKNKVTLTLNDKRVYTPAD